MSSAPASLGHERDVGLDRLGWAVHVLREQGMPPEDLRAVLTTLDGVVMHRYLELHLERLEERLVAQRDRLNAAERILADSINGASSVAGP